MAVFKRKEVSHRLAFFLVMFSVVEKLEVQTFGVL